MMAGGDWKPTDGPRPKSGDADILTFERVKQALTPYIDEKIHEANVPNARFMKQSEATLMRVEQDLKEVKEFMETRADA